MKKLILAIVTISLLTGCLVMRVRSTPVRIQDGVRTYTLTTIYGGLNAGTKEGAVERLNKYANQVCKQGYKVLNEILTYEPPHFETGYTMHYVTEIVWEVQCNADPKPADS